MIKLLYLQGINFIPEISREATEKLINTSLEFSGMAGYKIHTYNTYMYNNYTIFGIYVWKVQSVEQDRKSRKRTNTYINFRVVNK